MKPAAAPPRNFNSSVPDIPKCHPLPNGKARENRRHQWDKDGRCVVCDWLCPQPACWPAPCGCVFHLKWPGRPYASYRDTRDRLACPHGTTHA